MAADELCVLVVDDEAVVLNLARIVLERAGYCVLLAADGAEALEVCLNDSQRIDLLLTDISMPRMNGIELARCVAERRPSVPVLFMSGYDGNSDVMRMFAAQPDMAGHLLIRKPFKSQELTETIGAMLQ